MGHIYGSYGLVNTAFSAPRAPCYKPVAAWFLGHKGMEVCTLPMDEALEKDTVLSLHSPALQCDLMQHNVST